MWYSANQVFRIWSGDWTLNYLLHTFMCITCLYYRSKIVVIKIAWLSFCANLVTICGRLVKITGCKSFNKQAEQWKTTIDSLCLNKEEGYAEAGKDIQIDMW